MDEDKPWLKPNQYGELPGGICCQRAMGKFCWEHNPESYLPDVPTGQIPSAKNQEEQFCQCNKVTNVMRRQIAGPWFCMRCGLNLFVKAVAVDTNEECETASRAHTGTKN